MPGLQQLDVECSGVTHRDPHVQSRWMPSINLAFIQLEVRDVERAGMVSPHPGGDGAIEITHYVADLG